MKVSPKAQCCITKWELYILSIGRLGIACFVFFICTITIGCIILLSTPSNFIASDVGEFIIEVTMLLLISSGLFFGAFTIFSLRGIIHISRQEVALNFSFKEEMQKYNISQLQKRHWRMELGRQYQDANWFIAISSNSTIAIHRDYIAEIYSVQYGWKRCKTTVIGIDGKVMKIIAGLATLKDFERWFYSSRKRVNTKKKSFWYLILHALKK